MDPLTFAPPSLWRHTFGGIPLEAYFETHTEWSYEQSTGLVACRIWKAAKMDSIHLRRLLWRTLDEPRGVLSPEIKSYFYWPILYEGYFAVCKAIQLVLRSKRGRPLTKEARGTEADYLYEQHITHCMFEVFLKKVMVSLLSISGI